MQLQFPVCLAGLPNPQKHPCLLPSVVFRHPAPTLPLHEPHFPSRKKTIMCYSLSALQNHWKSIFFTAGPLLSTGLQHWRSWTHSAGLSPPMCPPFHGHAYANNSPCFQPMSSLPPLIQLALRYLPQEVTSDSTHLTPSPCLRCMSGLYTYFAGAQARNLGAISDLPLPSASSSSQPPHPAHPTSLVARNSLLFIPILVTWIPATFPPVSLAPCSPSSPLWLESSELKNKSYLNLLHDFP